MFNNRLWCLLLSLPVAAVLCLTVEMALPRAFASKTAPARDASLKTAQNTAPQFKS